MSRFVAAYDISHPSARRKVSELLLEYGVRLQWSVFEIDLSPGELGEFRRRIGALLDVDDRFDLVPIDVHPQRARLAWQRAPLSPAVVFL